MQFKKLANQGWNGRRMTRRRRRRREYPALSSTYVERILNFAAASIVSSAEWITSVITIDPVALPSPSRVNVSNYVWPGKERQLLISRCIYGSIRVSSKTRPSFQIHIYVDERSSPSHTFRKIHPRPLAVFVHERRCCTHIPRRCTMIDGRFFWREIIRETKFSSSSFTFLLSSYHLVPNFLLLSLKITTA